MEYLQENWVEVLLALHVVALAVVNLTPTPKDNQFISKTYRWIELVAGLATKKSKEGA